jgi:hypothetical protein
VSDKQSHPWVGEFNDGEVVVFDPDAQRRDEPDWVFLWSRQSRRMERYAKDIVRNAIRKTADKLKTKAAIADYRAHHREEEDRGRKKLAHKAETNHRKYIERLGLAYAGTRLAPARTRVAWCWSCKEKIDNQVQLECKVCAWMLCECGACGCGRA